MKKIWLALFLVLGFGAATAAPVAPDVAIKDTTEKMRVMISANHATYTKDKAQFYALVDEVLVPRFDVLYISQLVLGKTWRTATPEQRNRFQTAFKNSLIRNYADALLQNYDTVEAKWQPLRLAAEANDATVKCDLLRKNGPPVQLSFAMREIDGDWKVYDVIIENLSLITNFRSQFNAEVKKNGLDALIQRIESTNFVKTTVTG